MQFGRAVINLFWLATGAYGTGVTVLLLLKFVGGSAWSPVEAFSSFLPVVLLPALMLGPLCLVRRRWRLAASLAVAILAFVVGYGGSFVPRGNAAPTAAALRFMTYNLHAETLQLEPMLALIRKSKADLVALQELSPEMAQAIEASLATDYPYRALHPSFENPILGQGVLSRYPIEADEYWRIALGHQRVVLDLRGVPLTLYNTHPVHPFRLRQGELFNSEGHRQEVSEVLARAGRDREPIIIAGDFNMSDQSSAYLRIRQRFNDAYRESGWGLGFTFPDFSHANAMTVDAPLLSMFIRPMARIDYVFHSVDLITRSARVLADSGGSDHRPVLVEFDAQ
ncbi:MAG: endonuclease/exonuclease/phosphatase family protein [Chloroflexi bacterium]|nr:endonuclease/exonuclease/phosphatase family protein [Chloroflexota bacterium]